MVPFLLRKGANLIHERKSGTKIYVLPNPRNGPPVLCKLPFRHLRKERFHFRFREWRYATLAGHAVLSDEQSQSLCGAGAPVIYRGGPLNERC